MLAVDSDKCSCRTVVLFHNTDTKENLRLHLSTCNRDPMQQLPGGLTSQDEVASHYLESWNYVSHNSLLEKIYQETGQLNKRKTITTTFYLCVICGKSFKHQVLLQLHGRYMTCKECNICFQSTKELQEQYNSKEEHVSVYKCELCAKVFFQECLFKFHLQKHNEEQETIKCGFYSNIYQCKMCTRYYGFQEIIPRGKVTRFQCRGCLTGLNNTENPTERQKKDMQQKHNEEQHLAICTCKVCGISFDDKRLLQIHEDLEQCKECNKCFDYVSARQLHYQQNHKTTYKCELCERSFLEESQWKDHLCTRSTDVLNEGCNRKEEIQNEVCDAGKCGFYSNIYLCEMCTRYYGFQERIPRGKVTRFQCRGCLTGLNNTDNPTERQKNDKQQKHNEEQHLAICTCKVCGRPFDDKRLLQIHEDFEKCKECSECFGSVSARQLHYREIHKTNYKCKLCERSFLEENQWKRHLCTRRADILNKGCNGKEEILTGKEEIQSEDCDRDAGKCGFYSNIYQCKMCTRYYGFQERIPRGNVTRFQCRECLTGLNNTENPTERQKEDKQQKHNEEQHLAICTCKVCGRPFDDKRLLQIHEDFEKCKECSECFGSVSARQLHYQEKHKTNYKCKLCERRFLEENQWKLHLCARSTDKLNKGSNGKVSDKGKCGLYSNIYQCKICTKYYGFAERMAKAERVTSFQCKACLNNTETPTDRQKKVQLQTTKRCDANAFKCEICGRKFFKEKLFNLHISKVQCKQCNKCFRTVTEKNKHQHEVHPWKCEWCEKKYKEEELLKRHQERSLCKECNECFFSYEGLRIHNLKLHPARFKCNLCEHCKFGNQESYDNHLKTTHCNDCNRCLCSSSKLSRHLNTDLHLSQFARFKQAKSSTNWDEIAKIFRCTKCPRTFLFERNLVKHQCQQKIHLCEKCGKSFITSSKLKQHSEIHNPKREVIKCNLCSKSIRGQYSFKMHLRTHNPHDKMTSSRNRTGEMSEIAGPVFEFAKQLQRNKCKHCGEAAVSTSLLVKHLRDAHPELTPYSCQKCAKKFRHRNHLFTHMRGHTGMRPYQCTCGRIFAHNTGLNLHLRVTGETGERGHRQRKRRRRKYQE